MSISLFAILKNPEKYTDDEITRSYFKYESDRLHLKEILKLLTTLKKIPDKIIRYEINDWLDKDGSIKHTENPIYLISLKWVRVKTILLSNTQIPADLLPRLLKTYKHPGSTFIPEYIYGVLKNKVLSEEIKDQAVKTLEALVVVDVLSNTTLDGDYILLQILKTPHISLETTTKLINDYRIKGGTSFKNALLQVLLSNPEKLSSELLVESKEILFGEHQLKDKINQILASRDDEFSKLGSIL
jgi:hypothetical protein